jgi:PAS domain S-box-containing protein
VPIVAVGELAALMEFTAAGGGPPDPALSPVLHAVGRQVGHVFERERARRRLEDSERRIRRVVERANDAYLEMGTDGRLTQWNPQAERTFGWPAHEVLGRPLVEVVVPPAQRSAHLAGVTRLFTTGVSRLDGQRLELWALHRDGHELPVELSLSVGQDDGDWHLSAFLHDISERGDVATTDRPAGALPRHGPRQPVGRGGCLRRPGAARAREPRPAGEVRLERSATAAGALGRGPC